ncbi:phosphate/phosphite/phosphonate ABC transporter substrate-binding protein [Anaerococcus sp. Marseille-P3625]|uniref:phosphate/phosphite/phosphonate ABC transporter substrate-binding protein n=1 Tax=Anaerococcus sp. Marseille-P3625 TaxID=1977277 RepID=UPI000C06D90D|nr:PhnD/SsuA/transferrin family substrate-binding protein [Anaerococcus sp. Marseille-P3625]
MNKLKVGAVIYAPRVTVIWELIEKFYKENGAEIEPVFFKDYKLQVDALINKDIDVAWNSPLAQLDARLRTDKKEKIGCMRDTDRDRRTYLVVKKDRFKEISDLKGKTIGFGAIDSPQARLIPINHLHKNGLEFGKDYEEKRFDIGVGLHGDHVGGELDSMKALLNDEVDATFCLDLNYDAWIADGTIDKNAVEVLDKTDYFDHCVFTFNPEVSDEDIKAFDEIMMRMDYNKKEDKEIMDLEGLTKWVDGRYDGFKQITEANEYLGNFLEGFNSAN